MQKSRFWKNYTGRYEFLAIFRRPWSPKTDKWQCLKNAPQKRNFSFMASFGGQMPHPSKTWNGVPGLATFWLNLPTKCPYQPAILPTTSNYWEGGNPPSLYFGLVFLLFWQKGGRASAHSPPPLYTLVLLVSNLIFLCWIILWIWCWDSIGFQCVLMVLGSLELNEVKLSLYGVAIHLY